MVFEKSIILYVGLQFERKIYYAFFLIHFLNIGKPRVLSYYVITFFRSLNLNLHVFIVQSIVMVNLNIYFAYLYFVLVSLCVFNQTNQI